MRAVRYHEGGDVSVLQLEHVDQPVPNPNEVLVEVRAASINPTDAKRRRRGVGPFPKTTGSDFAGVVEAVGSDVSGFEPGDRVCGTGLHTTRFHQGSFAEYVSVPTDVVTLLPDSVSFEEGAAVALVGVTAWWGLVDHAGLRPTDTCLVHGGTGGVGHVAVQLSQTLHARTVATASPGRLNDAEALGADIAVSYGDERLLETVSELVNDGYDVVFDHRASDYFTLDVEAAAFRGRIVLYGNVSGKVELTPRAIRNNLTLHVMTMSNLATRPGLPTIAEILERVLGLVDRGSIRPRIARTYGLDEAAEVHRAILEDSFVGKLVVTT